MTDPEMMLVADVHGLAGRSSELLALLSDLAAGASAEPDCFDFRVLADGEPGEFVLLCSWRNDAALRTHYATAHYRRYREQVGPLLERPSDVTIHQLAATVHPRDPNPPDPGELG
jgi:quinol monooxygenase YgiN